MKITEEFLSRLENRARSFESEVREGVSNQPYWKTLKPIIRMRRANHFIPHCLRCISGRKPTDAAHVLSSVAMIVPEFWNDVKHLPSQHPNIEEMWEHARVWGDVAQFAGTIAICSLRTGSNIPKQTLVRAIVLRNDLLQRADDLSTTREGLRRCNRELKIWTAETFIYQLLTGQYGPLVTFYCRYFAWPTERRESPVENVVLKLSYMLALKATNNRDVSIEEKVTTKMMSRIITVFQKSLGSATSCGVNITYLYLLDYLRREAFSLDTSFGTIASDFVLDTTLGAAIR